MTPLESCIGVTGHRNPPGTQKPWTSPRKRPEMPEITSFDDAARVMYRGSRCIEILPGPEKTVDYTRRKRPEMLEITSFDDAARVVYRGSRGIEILQGPKNDGLWPTKTAKNTRNHEF